MASTNSVRHTEHKALACIPHASMLLTAFAIAIHFSSGLRTDLLYDRCALSRLELWRLVTCHWVHLSWEQLFWSTITFCVLGSACEILDKKKYYTAVAISALVIPAAIWCGLPNLAIYGGLSGLDCALYTLMLTLLIKREANIHNWVWVSVYAMGLVGLLAKIIYETATGQTVFVSHVHTKIIPIHLAHLVGGSIGIIVGIWELIKDSIFLVRWSGLRIYR